MFDDKAGLEKNPFNGLLMNEIHWNEYVIEDNFVYIESD